MSVCFKFVNQDSQFYITSDRQSVGPDLGPNCLQRLSADDKVTASKASLEAFYKRLNEPIPII